MSDKEIIPPAPGGSLMLAWQVKSMYNHRKDSQVDFFIGDLKYLHDNDFLTYFF